ncbi:hypothetical protein EV121DRAFT_298065 [Schizophyllum commune]
MPSPLATLPPCHPWHLPPATLATFSSFAPLPSSRFSFHVLVPGAHPLAPLRSSSLRAFFSFAPFSPFASSLPLAPLPPSLPLILMLLPLHSSPFSSSPLLPLPFVSPFSPLPLPFVSPFSPLPLLALSLLILPLPPPVRLHVSVRSDRRVDARAAVARQRAAL